MLADLRDLIEKLRQEFLGIHRDGAYSIGMDEARTAEEEVDSTEMLRLAIIALGIAANLIVVYWQLKDTADMIEMRAKARAWWERHFAGPERWRRELARMEGETVLEAIQIVEEQP